MSKKSKKKIVPDIYHYHEAIDRIYLIGRMLEDFVIEHPICMRHKKVRKKIESALQELAEAYQMVGGYDAKNDELAEKLFDAMKKKNNPKNSANQ